MGVENSKMLRYLFELQPEASKLFHLIKMLLPRYEINFDGYLLKLLVIFYFQCENLLPSIKQVQENLPDKIISEWKIQLPSNRKLSAYNIKMIQTYKDHVPNFFKFYATFQYHKNIMSTHFGKNISRMSYCYNEEVKPENMLSIFGPINQKHNLGKYVKKDRVQIFVRKCEGIYFGFLRYHPWNNMKRREELYDNDPDYSHFDLF